MPAGRRSVVQRGMPLAGRGHGTHVGRRNRGAAVWWMGTGWGFWPRGSGVGPELVEWWRDVLQRSWGWGFLASIVSRNRSETGGTETAAVVLVAWG